MSEVENMRRQRDELRAKEEDRIRREEREAVVRFLRAHSLKSAVGSALMAMVADQIERGEHAKP